MSLALALAKKRERLVPRDGHQPADGILVPHALAMAHAIAQAAAQASSINALGTEESKRRRRTDTGTGRARGTEPRHRPRQHSLAPGPAQRGTEPPPKHANACHTRRARSVRGEPERRELAPDDQEAAAGNSRLSSSTSSRIAPESSDPGLFASWARPRVPSTRIPRSCSGRTAADRTDQRNERSPHLDPGATALTAANRHGALVAVNRRYSSLSTSPSSSHDFSSWRNANSSSVMTPRAWAALLRMSLSCTIHEVWPLRPPLFSSAPGIV